MAILVRVELCHTEDTKQLPSLTNRFLMSCHWQYFFGTELAARTCPRQKRSFLYCLILSGLMEHTRSPLLHRGRAKMRKCEHGGGVERREASRRPVTGAGASAAPPAMGRAATTRKAAMPVMPIP